MYAEDLSQGYSFVCVVFIPQKSILAYSKMNSTFDIRPPVNQWKTLGSSINRRCYWKYI